MHKPIIYPLFIHYTRWHNRHKPTSHYVGVLVYKAFQAFMEFYNLVFDSDNQPPEQWSHQEFEGCTFRKLTLSQTILSGANFIDCAFDTCNLMGVELRNTKLFDVRFSQCRLTQVDFSPCNGFGFHVDFQYCQLDHAIFLNRNLKKSQFIECSLKEAHFLKCDLSHALFEQCDLELAKFGENNLTAADFSTSFNLRLNPEDNILKKARFSLHNLPGLLGKYNLVIVP